MPYSLLLAATTATTVAKSKSSSSSYSFLIIIALFAGVYLLVLRPRNRRMRQQQTTGGSVLSIGDEVISIGGILGTVTAVDGDEIDVEVAPGTTMTFWRRAVNLRTAVKGAPQGRSTFVADEDEASYDDDGAELGVDESGHGRFHEDDDPVAGGGDEPDGDTDGGDEPDDGNGEDGADEPPDGPTPPTGGAG